MRWVFSALILLHGALHFAGFAKAFGLAELSQLGVPISRTMGIAWLVAGGMLLATAGMFVRGIRGWWAVGFGAVLLSQIVVISSWSDARFGTIVNGFLLVGVGYGFASRGPFSSSAHYRREVRLRIAHATSQSLVTDRDLEHLPDPVQRYLRMSGAVGQPRVQYFSAVWRGRIREKPDDAWMEFKAEQHNFPSEPARFFLMDARKGGLPVDVYHAFRDHAATMRVKLLSLFPLVSAKGPKVDRAEAVTLFNDLCILAPAALLDSAIEWEPIDMRSVRGRYTVGSNTVCGVLLFNEKDELVDFVSEDRLIASSDGRQFTRQRWSTPVGAYRDFGRRRVSTRGEGRWHPSDGEYSYLEVELLDLQTNGE
jgi:hypothetical protein